MAESWQRIEIPLSIICDPTEGKLEQMGTERLIVTVAVIPCG